MRTAIPLILALAALIVTVVGCSEDPFIKTWDCPDDRLERMEEMIMSCRIENRIGHCTDITKELLCDESFIPNPNYIEN